MAFDYDRRSATRSGVQDYSLDMGLRSFMLKVYNYMFIGLGLTGVVSYFASQSHGLMAALHGGLYLVVIIAMLVMAFMLPTRVMKMSTQAGLGLFFVFAGLMGLSCAYIFLAYTGTSIVRTFFITAATFGAMSLYGYTTKKDLTNMGTFLIMALFGVIIASVVNMFMKSTGMEYVLSILGVLIFTGLTAYDTQKVKEIYLSGDTGGMAERKAIIGAFILFLDFINLFLNLLRLFGDRK